MELAGAKLMISHGRAFKYQGARMRSTYVPPRVARESMTVENGWDRENIKKYNDQSDEEFGIYIDE